tara:strand:+ start:307 stop:753 length:447 start_codon:yes stop_codon:yes gene_type:complete
MAFATNSDLLEIMPDLFDHGKNDYGTELGKAETDIKKVIKTQWFDKEYSNYSIRRLTITGSAWDDTKLDDTQWTLCCVYRALAYYILPQLSNFRPEGDAFREQVEFYQARYQEQMDLEFGFGIRYDSNNDASYSEAEKHEVAMDRMYR